jgi:hypothetical protein
MSVKTVDPKKYQQIIGKFDSKTAIYALTKKHSIAFRESFSYAQKSICPKVVDLPKSGQFVQKWSICQKVGNLQKLVVIATT